FGGNFAPRGWAFCDGSLLSISQNQALFSILGTTYGGDGRTTFALPDLRGRVVIGPRSGPGLSTYSLGQKGGVEDVTLNQNQIPAHTHQVSVPVSAEDADQNEVEGNFLANGQFYHNNPDAVYGNGPLTSTQVGGSQSHENRQPFLAVNYIIALTGTFPSRN
ncbi:MAG: tail fiber protein, partial [Bacteroidota bacterium]